MDRRPLYEAVMEEDKMENLVAEMSPEQMSLFLQDVYTMMEEFANTTKEEYGKRQPGETCAYERPVRQMQAIEDGDLWN